MNKANCLFEVSFEVCNKVGGIYTVVTSKAERILAHYKGSYILIGPYFSQKALGEFEEELPDDSLKSIFNELKQEGIICHYGKWLIKGEPSVILIDFNNFKHRADDIKKELWDNFKVDSLRAGNDYDEPVVWSYCTGKLIEKLVNRDHNKKCVAHFHEWLSGAGLLYLKSRDIRIGKVFHTHATILGRTLASSDIDIYKYDTKAKCCLMGTLDPVAEAYSHNMEHKYLLERKCAEQCEIFTTVSEITGMEAEYLLKRKPDILLPNGLDIEKFPTFEEISIKHKLQRDRIREFCLSYFFPYYQFNLQQSLFFFLAGRYEFHDKGIDIYIKALGKLNDKLKLKKNPKTIIAFIWVPANIRGIKQELLENEVHYKDVKDLLEENTEDIKRNISYAITAGKELNSSPLFEEDFVMEMKRKLMMFQKKGIPPISTHDIYDQNDIILSHLREAGLGNRNDDPVKVIFYPIYLSGADGLLNLSYYEAMQGSHLGIFPSYYEPWGYTPLEAGALGVSSITTDLAGFGRYIQKYSKEVPEKQRGIFVLNRFGNSDDKIINDLTKTMFSFANLNREQRVANKMQARKLAKLADWSIMSNHYIEAHNMAVDRAFK